MFYFLDGAEQHGLSYEVLKEFEMTNARLIGITIVDSHKAEFWSQIFDKITVYKDLAVNTGDADTISAA